MLIERTKQPSKDATLYSDVIDYNTGLQRLTPPQLQATFFKSIDSYPALQADSEELRKAYTNMSKAHAGQIRRLSGEPYEVHALKVTLLSMKLLEMLDIPITTEAVKAALKHDMVEDGKTRGITINTIKEQSGPVVAVMVDALTRHEEDGALIGHKQAAKKVRKAHEEGVAYVQVIKVADRTENVRDQPGVQRPLLHEHVLFFSDAYRNSEYGKWQRTKWRTRLVFSGIVAKGEPKLKGVLKEAIKVTQREIHDRPRKAIKA